MKIMTERQFYEELHEREKRKQEIQELKNRLKELDDACKHNRDAIERLEKQVNVIERVLEGASFISTADREEMIIKWLDGTER